MSTATPPSSVKFRILIVGGGITGLAASIPLCKQGHSVTIFERAEAFQELGGNLYIPPNAAKILDSYGVWQSIEEVSEKPETHTIWNHHGEVLDIIVHEEMRLLFGHA